MISIVIKPNEVLQRSPGKPIRSAHRFVPAMLGALLCTLYGMHANAQQPPEPVDISPINGEVYYVVNQLSGLQLDLNDNSATAGDEVLQQTRSFTISGQRWAVTKLQGEGWAISNLANGLCLDSSVKSGITWTVLNPCALATATQQWSVEAASNGYATLLNKGTGLA